MFRHGILGALVLALLAALVGCSNPPVTDQSAAAKEIATAQQMEAETFATPLWRMAQDTLAAAEAEKARQDDRFSLFRSYGDAQKLYQSAATLAVRAGEEAQIEKSRVRQEIGGSIDEATAEVNSLSGILVAFPVTKDVKADLELLRRDVAALETLLQEAPADLDRGSFDVARTKTETVMQRVSEYKEEVEATSGRVKLKAKA